MTLSSRRKHPITPRSIRRSTSVKHFCRSAGFALLFGLAGNCLAADDFVPPVITESAESQDEAAAETDPGKGLLERLPPPGRVSAKPGEPGAGLGSDAEDFSEPTLLDESEEQSFLQLERDAQDQVTPYGEPVRDPSKLKKLREIRPFYSPPEPGLLPEEIAMGQTPYQSREFPPFHEAWESSNVWHNPLYFEDFQLERYGHSVHPLIQPVVSAGKFTGQLATLPYAMTLKPIRSRDYALGYYRPGEFVPYKIYQIPWNLEAAMAEAAVVTGAFYLFP